MDKIFVATPMYGGQCFGTYCVGMIDLSGSAIKKEMSIQYGFIYNESLITRARNRLAYDFLKSDCEMMLFIDADIGFRADDVRRLIDVAKANKEFQIVAASYPKKNIFWDRIIAAASDKNIPEPISPSNALHYGTEFAVYGALKLNRVGLMEVDAAPTGFMLIKREIFVAMDTLGRLKTYYDAARDDNVSAYFDTVIDDRGNYLTEDYSFCIEAKKAMGRILVDTSVSLTHSGTFLYSGNFQKSLFGKREMSSSQ